MTIGIAIIGSGIFVKEQHLPTITSYPALSLKAIYSRSFKSAQTLASLQQSIKPNLKLDLYSDDQKNGANVQDLLARKDIDAVVIALPIVIQPDFVKMALSAGKHVLAEKPMAKDVQTATSLLHFYQNCNTAATLSIAENLRFVPSMIASADLVKDMGRVLSFIGKQQVYIEAGSPYYETSWRKKPEYQGGYLLDGGIHAVAGLRLLLGPENQPRKLTAFTCQTQKHLPPIDTVHSIWRVNDITQGVFTSSFGTTFQGNEFSIAMEKGTINVAGGILTIRRDNKDEGKKNFNEEGFGVGIKEEYQSWIEYILTGKQDPRLSPEEALKDLKVLEGMLVSGEQNGVPVDIHL